MRHSLVKFVFVLFLAKIDRLDSRPVEVIYTGDGCECPKNLPYEVNIPVLPEPAPLYNPSHGYMIDIPVQPRAKYTYSLDFVVDEPVPPTPPPTPKANLFAVVDRVVLPKHDCVVETVAPCGLPAPPAPPAPPPPPPPQPAPTVVVKDYDYEIEVPVVTKSCASGDCTNPLKPSCRYVLNNKFQTNRIARQGDRSKRDITSKNQHHMSELRSLFKSRKAARDARKLKKSKIVKRDIKGEYDLLEKERAAVDLTIPEIIQYMPETLLPQFKRGKCNIGCKNKIKRQKQHKENKSTSETANNDSNPQAQQQPTVATTESTHTMPMPSQQYLLSSPQYAGVGYLKRSVNPYQYPCPCYPPVMPPPYIPSPLHLATVAQNPGNPIWAQPRPLIDPIGHYVFDRLGHKYEVKNGSLKLVPPQFADELNVSAPDTPITDGDVNGEPIPITAQQTEIPQSIVGGQQLLQQAPIVGAQAQPYSSHDPQMDKVIRDIIYHHPDFVEATKHEPGSLTQPQNVQQDETMQFLGKLIRGRLNNWFDINEEAPTQNLDELGRYSRETGTSIKFIPVVTVDKEKLNKYRQGQAKATK